MQLLGHWPLCYALTSQRNVILTVRAFAPTPGFYAAQCGAVSSLRLVPLLSHNVPSAFYRLEPEALGTQNSNSKKSPQLPVIVSGQAWC